MTKVWFGKYSKLTKVAEKETLVHTGGKNPLFLAHQKGDIFSWGGGLTLSHVHFCVSVSTQFVAFLEAIHIFGKFAKNNIERQLNPP